MANSLFQSEDFSGAQWGPNWIQGSFGFDLYTESRYTSGGLGYLEYSSGSGGSLGDGGTVVPSNTRSLTDSEVHSIWHSKSNISAIESHGHVHRLSSIGTRNPSFYAVQSFPGVSTKIAISLYVDGSLDSYLAMQNFASLTLPFNVKSRIVDTLIQVKAWNVGDTEPDWSDTAYALSITDNDLTSGYAGVMYTGLTQTNAYVAYEDLYIYGAIDTPHLYASVNRSKWLSTSSLTQWNQRYRGVRESQKMNREISATLYDLRRIKEDQDAIAASMYENLTNLEDGGELII